MFMIVFICILFASCKSGKCRDQEHKAYKSTVQMKTQLNAVRAYLQV